MSVGPWPRAALRHLALDAIALGGQVTRSTERGLARSRVAVVYFHAIPANRLPHFERLVAKLAEGHDLVSYSRAVELIHSGEAARPTVAFSFDDGFKSNLDAARALGSWGVSACFFVPTGGVGCRSVEDARIFFGMAAGVPEPTMTWSELERLVDAGHEVGNHTVSHRTISALPEEQVADEIGAAREMLQSRLGQGDHFAWPRGLFQHFSPAAARAVFEVGHTSCASAERGSHVGAAGTPRPCIRREHLMAEWPLRHSMRFVSVGDATVGEWPEGWEV